MCKSLGFIQGLGVLVLENVEVEGHYKILPITGP